MVKLIDGLGQLGSKLQRVKREDRDCIIYHTWNIDDGSEGAQRKEYEKFVDFADANKDEKVFFISTKQGKEEHYLHYKLRAELYLLEKIRAGHIIRIPKLIGKGLCQSFRDGYILPFAEPEEIITAEDAAIQIMNMLDTDRKMNVVVGEWMDKRTIYNLIKFGAAKCE
jgi:hypothetical protein